jgi:hypothetical protein
MGPEQQPGIWVFVSETVPLAVKLAVRGAIVAIFILFGCSLSKRSDVTSANRESTWTVVTAETTTPEASSVPAENPIPTGSVPERLPPVAKCQRLPAVEESSRAVPVAVTQAAPSQRQVDLNSAKPAGEIAAQPCNASVPPPAAQPGEGSVDSQGRDHTIRGEAVAGAVMPLSQNSGCIARQDIRLPVAFERQARERLQHACEMADRGALFSARRECLRIFRSIAHTLDVGAEQPMHNTALTEGLCALDEADDFILANQHLESTGQLEGLIASHRSTVLKCVNTALLHPQMAINAYYEFASQQLAQAGGSQPVSSEVLFALGRMEMLMRAEDSQRTAATPKAAVYFTAALAVDASHGLAANELGVLLAGSGRLEEARTALEHAVRVNPTSTTTQNLAAVELRLNGSLTGATAVPASTVSPSSSAQPGGPAPGSIQFVDPQTFVRLSETTAAPFEFTTTRTIPAQPGQPQGESVTRTAEKSWFGF